MDSEDDALCMILPMNEGTVKNWKLSWVMALSVVQLVHIHTLLNLHFHLLSAVTNAFPALFRNLDAQMAVHGASNYGLTSSSLEEIFLKVHAFFFYKHPPFFSSAWACLAESQF